MNERSFVIIFLIVTAIAVAGLVLNKVADQTSVASPSASPTGLIFDTQSQSPQLSSQQNNQIKQWSSPPAELSPAQLQNKVVVIKTAKGQIAFSISPEATMTASNFIFLAQNHFYDGLTFHRVVPGFVIQGGDPLGNGTGGPGYKFADELTGNEKYTKGTVAMANSGPNTNGSQFFIMLDDHPELPASYTIFGHVIQGQDVVDKIVVGDVMQSVQVEQLK